MLVLGQVVPFLLHNTGRQRLVAKWSALRTHPLRMSDLDFQLVYTSAPRKKKHKSSQRFTYFAGSDFDKPGHGGVVTEADAALQMAEGEANAKVHSMALAGNDAAEAVDDAAQESMLSSDEPQTAGTDASEDKSALQRVADSAVAALHAGAPDSEGVVTEEEAQRQMAEGEANEKMHSMARAGDEAAEAALDTAAGADALSPGDATAASYATRTEERQSEAHTM